MHALDQCFSNFHDLWPPSKDSQHLWPLLINKNSYVCFGFCNIMAELYKIKASACGPRRTASWTPRGLRAPVEKPCLRAPLLVNRNLKNHWYKTTNKLWPCGKLLRDLPAFCFHSSATIKTCNHIYFS